MLLQDEGEACVSRYCGAAGAVVYSSARASGVEEPRALPDFPVVYLELASAAVLNGTELQISFRINGGTISDRLRIIGKIQHTAPGYGCHQGKLCNHIGIINNDGQVIFTIQNYKDASGLDLNEYQMHLRYLLIDAESGHRSREHSLSAGISI